MRKKRHNVSNFLHRRISVPIFLLLIGFSLNAKSINPKGDIRLETKATQELSLAEMNSIIQKCLDANDLQKYYPANPDKTLQAINIVNYPFAFPDGMNVSVGDQKVNFIKGDLMPTMTDAHFTFRRVDATDHTVMVMANYYYNHSSDGFKIISIMVEFEKSGSDWNLKTINVEGNTL